MSVSASIDISLAEKDGLRVPASEILNVLVNSGWRLSYDGKISYLPLGDETCSHWHLGEKIDFNMLSKILKEKEKAKEVVGVLMSWNTTSIGGTFLFWPKEKTFKTFSLDLNADRPTIKLADNYVITDFQWYLERLLPPLNNVFGVEYFSFEQHI